MRIICFQSDDGQISDEMFPPLGNQLDAERVTLVLMIKSSIPLTERHIYIICRKSMKMYFVCFLFVK